VRRTGNAYVDLSRLASVLISLVLLAALTACASTGAAVPTPDPVSVQAATAAAVTIQPLVTPSSYRIQSGDGLDIRFFYTPELNSDVIVPPGGEIALPLIGQVSTTGLTAVELSNELRAAYGAHLTRPDVTVIFRDIAPRAIYVAGEVAAPGMITFRSPMTVTQALFAAGGPKDSAEMESVILISGDDQGRITYSSLDMKTFLSGEGELTDPIMGQGDLLFLPKSGVAKANQWVDQWLRQMMPFVLSFGFFFGIG